MSSLGMEALEMVWTRWALVCLVCAAVLAGARPGGAVEAQAQEVAIEAGDNQPSAVEPRARGPAKSWYGYQTLAVDGVALGLLLAGIMHEQSPLVWAAAGTYLLGAPLVHLAHGGGATLPSLALRLAAPAMFALGAAACAPTAGAVAIYMQESYQIDLGVLLLGMSAVGLTCGIAVAGVVAFPAAILMDAKRLAYDRVEPTPSEPQSLVVPSYDPTRRAAMLSWAGTF